MEQMSIEFKATKNIIKTGIVGRVIKNDELEISKSLIEHCLNHRAKMLGISVVNRVEYRYFWHTKSLSIFRTVMTDDADRSLSEFKKLKLLCIQSRQCISL